jgi:hypothetical protein
MPVFSTIDVKNSGVIIPKSNDVCREWAFPESITSINKRNLKIIVV